MKPNALRVGTAATLLALATLNLAACSPAIEPSEHTEWLAATSGTRDTAKVQELLDEIHTNIGLEPGPEIDKWSVHMLADYRGSTLTPLLTCMAEASEREDGGDFQDLITRCDDDFWNNIQ